MRLRAVTHVILPTRLGGDSEMMDIYVSFMVIAMLRQPLNLNACVPYTCFPNGINVLHLTEKWDIAIDLPVDEKERREGMFHL